MSTAHDGRGGRGSPTAGPRLEASGGLTLERAREVAATGVDFISVGALTHSAQGASTSAMDLRRTVSPLLCADIGNSHTDLGLLDDGDVVDHWRVATDERRTADEWGVLLTRPARRLARSTAALRGVAVCATVPAVLHEWRDMLRTLPRRRAAAWSSSRACAPAYRC